MPKKEQGEAIISETGNWNVADTYSKSKIMKPLILCDFYEDVAMFGYESLVEELINFESPPNDIIRIKAMQRLIKELIRLIDNTKFALKKQGTREKALRYMGDLKKIYKAIPNLVLIHPNKQISIADLDLFNDFLEKISEIKSKINEPLNQNHLIFTDKEEFDPIAFKTRLKRRMVEQG
jgi:hypothetical protein